MSGVTMAHSATDGPASAGGEAVMDVDLAPHHGDDGYDGKVTPSRAACWAAV